MGNLQLNTQSPGALTETLKSIKLQINPISLAILNKLSYVLLEYKALNMHLPWYSIIHVLISYPSLNIAIDQVIPPVNQPQTHLQIRYPSQQTQEPLIHLAHFTIVCKSN